MDCHFRPLPLLVCLHSSGRRSCAPIGRECVYSSVLFFALLCASEALKPPSRDTGIMYTQVALARAPWKPLVQPREFGQVCGGLL